jgi:hypothetical protein
VSRRHPQEPERFQARFSGRFDVPTEDTEAMTLDDELMVVAVVRVDAETQKSDLRSGDLVWTGTLGVRQAAVVRNHELARRLFDELELAGPEPELPFYDLQHERSVVEVSHPEVSVDVNGEVFTPDAGRLPPSSPARGSKDLELQSFLEGN